MTIKSSVGSRIFDILNYTFMIIMMAITVYPFLNVFAISVSGHYYVSSGMVGIIPKGFNIEMYKLLLRTEEVLISYKNTVLYAAVGTAIMLFLNSIYAYTLSKPDLPAKGIITVYLAVTMFFSGGLIPTYLTIRALGGINTFWVMVLPFSVSAWTIIVMRTFFQGIPYSLTESALMDGAGELAILSRLIIPLSKPLYATMALFAVVGIWNSWFNAIIYLTDNYKWPIQAILRHISVIGKILTKESNNDALRQAAAEANIIPQSYKYAMMMIVIIPIVALYPFFQRYFIKGVMIGAIKG